MTASAMTSAYTTMTLPRYHDGIMILSKYHGGGMRKVDLVGQRFGRLVVIAREGSVPSKRHGRSRTALWRCLCDCGLEVTIRGNNLTSGNTKSCGCLYQRSRGSNRTHGLTGTLIYARWRGMLQRCINPNNRGYARYGGRGITVCARWLSFANFHADMGDPPPGMTLDRVDNDGPYSPENCRWATPSRQARNKRASKMATLHGQTKPLADWADEYGISYQLVFYRLQDGWDLGRALTASSQRKP